MSIVSSITFKKATNFAFAFVIAVSTLTAAMPFIFSNNASAITCSVVDGDDLQAKVTAASAGDTLNICAGDYAASNIVVNKELTLNGLPGARLLVNPAVGTQVNALYITANDVTVTGLEIEGEVNAPYTTYPWGSTVSRGIAVSQGITGFSITGNNIHDVRNGVLIDGRNSTGTLSNNVIENTKGAVSIQYTNASALNVSGNSEGAIGNAWGFNLHLNGNFDFDGTLHSNPYPGGVAPAGVQAAILALKNANGGLTVQDQGYQKANRTDVNVATTGLPTGQGDLLGKISTVQLGLDAIVAGGNVYVANGSYVESIQVKVSGTNLIGESKAGVQITSNGTTTTGHAVSVENVDNVTIENMSFFIGTVGNPGYALKAYNTASLQLQNLDFNGRTYVSGPRTGGVDLNSVNGASISNVSASGFSKNGFAVSSQFYSTDPYSRNITFNNISSSDNAWAGIAFYMTNSSGTVGHSIPGISFTGTTTVSGNPKGLEIVGDTDANVFLGAIPPYTVTDASGDPISLGSALFNSNTLNVINYQTEDVLATDVSFDGKKGSEMTEAERTALGDTILDVNDSSFLGEVVFYIAPVVPPVDPTDPTDTTDDGDNDGTNDDEDSTAVATTTPIITSPGSSVLGEDTTGGETDVEGVSDTKTETEKGFDGLIAGIAWYWWLLVLAVLGGASWWVVGAIRRRNDETSSSK